MRKYLSGAHCSTNTALNNLTILYYHSLVIMCLTFTLLQFYKDVLEVGELAKLAFFNDIVVGGYFK